ncbi:MAG: 2-oxoglutarate dehydrogenase E1 subunit family protein, partial [Planctomycetia bacterium]
MSTTERAGPAGGVDLAGTANLAFLEELFEHYQRDPASVDPEWRAYFAGVAADGGMVAAAASPAAKPEAKPAANGHAHAGNGQPIAKLVAPDGIATARAVAMANGEVKLPAAPPGEAMPLPLPVATGTAGEERVAFLQDRVDQLVRAYRVRGHLMAEIDPLGRPRPGLPELDPQFYHLTEEDMDRSFSTDTIEG